MPYKHLLLIGKLDVYTEQLQVEFEDLVHVTHSRSGEEALYVAQNYHPDVVVLDFWLDKGKRLLHGLQVLNVLKQDAQTHHIPIIVFSDELNDRYVQDLVSLNHADASFLKSQENLPKLVEAIQKYLDIHF